jgi:hypothetical protein
MAAAVRPAAVLPTPVVMTDRFANLDAVLSI